MGIEFRLIESGIETTPLPDLESVSLSPVFCDAGAVEFSYPRDGVNWQALGGKDEIRIAVYVDGVRQPRLDAILQDIDGDDIKEAGVWKYTGFFNLGRLNEARVYPKAWPAFDPQDTKYGLTSVTAGTIMRTFLLAAQARGTLTDITFSSFSTTTDSNGVPWTMDISIEYAPGLGLLEIIKGLYQSGMCEYEMVGTDLRMYVPGTMGVDRTTSPLNPLVFRKGRDLADSPRKTSTRGLATVMLGAGDEGLYHEEVNAGAVATRRRIEGSTSQGQIKDPGTLEAYTEAQLDLIVDPKMQKSHALKFTDPVSPRPIRDFDLGDWAYSDVGLGLERLRIKQWVLKYDRSGELSGSVVLNDLIDEQNALLTRRVAGIVGGSTITGASQAVNHVPDDLVDGIAPGAPTSISLTSAPFVDDQGNTLAAVVASWPQVTVNADGTPCEDLAGYTVEWRYLGSPTWHILDTRDTVTTMMWSPVAPAAQIEARVRAYDRAGNYGLWSPVQGHTTQDDATPPAKPSTPIADVFMGLLRCTFDGNTASGAAWEMDVSYFKVHASTTFNFTPTAATWVDTLTDAGSTYLDPGYGQSRYFRIVAVDRSGNESAPSDTSAQVTTSQVVSSDVFDGAIGTAKLADLAVTTAKINDLAVNNAKIGSVSAGKITAGIIVADLTVGARVATALTGKRAEMNSVGFQAWNTAGTLTLSLDGENNLMSGWYRTALVGRRIEIGASGSVAEVNFYGPAGQLGQVRGFTADNTDWNTEAISLRLPIAGTNSSWNQVSISSDEDFYVSTGSANFLLGGGAAGNQGFQIRWLTNKVLSGGINGTGNPRFIVNDLNTLIYGPTGHLGFYVTNTSGQQDLWTRTQVYSTANNFGGAMDVTYWRSDCSPAIRLLQSNMASGGVMFYDTSSFWFSFATANGSAFETIRVEAVDTTSDEAAKKSIRKFGQSARSKIAPMEAHTYEMRSSKSGRRRLGFMAASAPDEVRVRPHKDDPIQHEGIDLYGLTTLGIEYAREIDADVDSLRQEIASLREELTKR